jgi:hypothetical protein
MPGHQEPMKDVGDRDRPRGVVNLAVIRGFPNGVTRHPDDKGCHPHLNV